MGIMGNRFVSVLSLVVTIYQNFQAILRPEALGLENNNSFQGPKERPDRRGCFAPEAA
jgi:hypothetical protein